jgi:hypothetical protein
MRRAKWRIAALQAEIPDRRAVFPLDPDHFTFSISLGFQL